MPGNGRTLVWPFPAYQDNVCRFRELLCIYSTAHGRKAATQAEAIMDSTGGQGYCLRSTPASR